LQFSVAFFLFPQTLYGYNLDIRRFINCSQSREFGIEIANLNHTHSVEPIKQTECKPFLENDTALPEEGK
jgi:hypothetical protein